MNGGKACPNKKRYDKKIAPFVEPYGVEHKPYDKRNRNSPQKYKPVKSEQLLAEHIAGHEDEKCNKPDERYRHSGNKSAVGKADFVLRLVKAFLRVFFFQKIYQMN